MARRRLGKRPILPGKLRGERCLTRRFSAELMHIQKIIELEGGNQYKEDRHV